MAQEVKRRRTAKAPEERRKDLLDAALAIFIRDGVADARVEDITSQAGVSKGTFYLYFKTKDEAAAAAWGRHMSAYADAGERILTDESAPIAQRLVDSVQSLCRFALDNAEVHAALYDQAGAEQVKSDTNERLIGMISAAARAGVDTGELVCVHPELTARALYHGFCGAATDAITGFVPLDRDEMIAAAGEMARAAFGLEVAQA